MIWLTALLIIVVLVVTALILYFTAYNKISIYKIKMDNSNKIITDNLQKKLELMNKLYALVKKSVKKKDYLKGFNELKDKNLSNYELDKELSEYLVTMITLKDDYKSLNTKDYKGILTEIKQIDQTIMANKVFFNKNNNSLIKQMKGYTKIVAKLAKISVKNSYEIKEPSKD